MLELFGAPFPPGTLEDGVPVAVSVYLAVVGVWPLGVSARSEAVALRSSVGATRVNYVFLPVVQTEAAARRQFVLGLPVGSVRDLVGFGEVSEGATTTLLVGAGGGFAKV